MKKILTLSAIIFMVATAASAQSLFLKRDKVVNFGIGLGNTLYGSEYTTKVPTMSLSFEYGVADGLFKKTGKGAIGVGAYIGYSSSSYKASQVLITPTPIIDSKNIRINNLLIGARGAFHYDFVRNLDTYAGMILGYNFASVSNSSNNNVGESTFVYSAFVGGRYYFSDNLAAMAEFGYGISILNLGISYRF